MKLKTTVILFSLMITGGERLSAASRRRQRNVELVSTRGSSSSETWTRFEDSSSWRSSNPIPTRRGWR